LYNGSQVGSWGLLSWTRWGQTHACSVMHANASSGGSGHENGLLLTPPSPHITRAPSGYKKTANLMGFLEYSSPQSNSKSTVKDGLQAVSLAYPLPKVLPRQARHSHLNHCLPPDLTWLLGYPVLLWRDRATSIRPASYVRLAYAVVQSLECTNHIDECQLIHAYPIDWVHSQPACGYPSIQGHRIACAQLRSSLLRSYPQR
jgi:hypothetical protein